jgi:hypothetical protein
VATINGVCRILDFSENPDLNNPGFGGHKTIRYLIPGTYKNGLEIAKPLLDKGRIKDPCDREHFKRGLRT